MPILRSSPPSPFGRKVKIAAHVAGLDDRIETVNADTNDPDDDLRQQNPLGKIPILVLDDGTALYDSRVIVEWLDNAAGGGVLIPGGKDRFDALVLQALADGMMDASILIIYESRFRPEEIQFSTWVDYQRNKVSRAMERLEANPPLVGSSPHIGHIALACLLGYLDFRFAGEWRSDHPRLVSWLDDFAAAVPAFAKTDPQSA
jgi:glutathione S-transferase